MYVHALMYNQFTEVVIDKVAIKHNSIHCILFYKQQYIHILCATGSTQIRVIPTYWTGDFNLLYKAVHDVALKHASSDRQYNDFSALHLHHRPVRRARTVYALYTVYRVILIFTGFRLKRNLFVICF